MVILGSLFDACRCERRGHMVNGEDMLENASDFLESKGISTEDKVVFLDEANKEWLATLQFIREDPNVERVLSQLSGMDYQAVRFSPAAQAHLTAGGVYWVFVDRVSKRVITYIGMR
jgi:hypothetical protein